MPSYEFTYTYIGFDVEEMRTIDTNLITHADSTGTIMKIITDSDMDDFHGFMTCLKVQNKNMCEIYNNNKKKLF